MARKPRRPPSAMTGTPCTAREAGQPVRLPRMAAARGRVTSCPVRPGHLRGVAGPEAHRPRALVRQAHAPLPPRLQLLGSGRHDALTELPQVLTTQGEARSVLRAVIREWARQAGDWAWLELPLTVDQGWFEPEWLTGTPAERGLVEHKTTRAAVVLDLPSDVSALHHGLKRNLLESTHRARNRLDRSGKPWAIAAHEEATTSGPPCRSWRACTRRAPQLTGRRTIRTSSGSPRGAPSSARRWPPWRPGGRHRS